MFQSFLSSVMVGLQDWLSGSIVKLIASLFTGFFPGS
jgi:hypothetical protein